MMELIDALHALGMWSAGALWIPMLVWTVLAAPLYLLAQHATTGRPLHRYRMLQALLLTLPVGLLAAAWVDASALFATWHSLSETAQGENAAWLLLPPELAGDATNAAATGPAWDAYHGLGLLSAIACLAACIQGARLVRAGCSIVRLRRIGPTAGSSPAQSTADHLAAEMGIRRPVRVQPTDEATVPLTFGTLRPIIVLPDALAEQPDALRMTLIHELIHVRRFDFLARWTEKLIAAVFAIHPFLPRLAQAIAASREMACDAEALHRLHGDRKRYANLLFSFSTLPTPQPAFAVSITDTSTSLKDRIHAMTQLDPSDYSPRFASLFAATLLVVLGLGIVACSDAVAPPAADETTVETESAQSETLSSDEVFIKVQERPQLKGGMQALQEAIQYPEAAKEEGIEGRVFVQFVVGENGDVLKPTVTRGVHESLDQAALNAVKDLSFEPGRQDGEAVKVKMALPVTFKLGNGESE